MEILTGTVVVALITYAVVHLLKYTDGPFGIFYHIRTVVGLEWDSFHQQEHVNEENKLSFIGEMLDCFWCTATWTSLAVALLYRYIFSEALFTFPFVWLSALGLVGILHEWWRTND